MSILCDHDPSVWGICENVKMHGFLRHICKYIQRDVLYTLYRYRYAWQYKPSIIYSKICTLQLRRNSAALSFFLLPPKKFTQLNFPCYISFTQFVCVFPKNSFTNTNQKNRIVKCLRNDQLACSDFFYNSTYLQNILVSVLLWDFKAIGIE